MKKLAILSLLAVCAGVSLFNTGCSARASLHPTSTNDGAAAAHVAYTTAPRAR